MGAFGCWVSHFLCHDGNVGLPRLRRSAWSMRWEHCSSLSGAKRPTEELKKQAEKMDADLDQKQKAFAGSKEEFDKKQRCP